MEWTNTTSLETTDKPADKMSSLTASKSKSILDLPGGKYPNLQHDSITDLAYACRNPQPNLPEYHQYIPRRTLGNSAPPSQHLPHYPLRVLAPVLESQTTPRVPC